jgi:hypothetical protein
MDGHMHSIKNKEVNMQRLENWLGAEKIDSLRTSMKGWYGGPINIRDIPGSVWINKDGTFTGKFNRGYFGTALDSLEDHFRSTFMQQPEYGMARVGFTSVSDALARATQGFSQRRPFNKAGPTGASLASSTLWRVGTTPAAGSAGAAAPGGTAHLSSDTGALAYANPASNNNYLTGADVTCSVASMTLMLYDRLFSVTFAFPSTAAANVAVTGVPTRYMSTTALNPDYSGDNFLFLEVGATALANTAHNWTGTYTNQAGTASQTIPSMTGNNSAIADRFDHPTQSWFVPLASGDTGIQAISNMQCSAAVATGSMNWVIGHPIAFLAFPVINQFIPFDWLTNRDLSPQIFNNACLAFLEPVKSATTATNYSGRFITTSGT